MQLVVMLAKSQTMAATYSNAVNMLAQMYSGTESYAQPGFHDCHSYVLMQ